jgi:hypothetical protein
MEKTAQKKSGKRSILNKLREMSNVSGLAAEKFFNPEFERVMNSLRESDNKIRAVVSGEEIEGEDPGEDLMALKDLYKSAKSNINRREYMTAIAFLGRFHKKLYEISNLVDKLNLDVDQVHHDFLFKDLDDEQKKHLSDLKSRLASTRHQLVAEAGIMDFLVNIGTERGKALAAWEKRYPKQVGKLKKDAVGLLQRTEGALNNIISVLKEMATARATRKVDDYVKAAAKLKNIYANYDKSFRDFYNANVKGFLEKQELVAPTKKVEDADLSSQKIDVSNTQPLSTPISAPQIPDLETPPPSPVPASSVRPVSEQLEVIPKLPEDDIELPSINPEDAPSLSKLFNMEKGLFSTPKVPTNIGPTTPPPAFTPPPEVELESIPAGTPPKTNPYPPPGQAKVKAHHNFYNALEKMSGESPLVLKKFIRRYAQSIQATDLETSLQLLKIANSIQE